LIAVSADEVHAVLRGREREIASRILSAYGAHGRGHSSLPPSSFLRFPGRERERIIALPARLGGEFDLVGIKWIASFPDNPKRGLERASAVMVMNSTETGLPQILLEASGSRAMRTGAFAALAAGTLAGSRQDASVGVIGCGRIAYECLRFLCAEPLQTGRIRLFDEEPANAERLAKVLQSQTGVRNVTVERDRARVLDCPICVLATTAVRPHIDSANSFAPGATVLHVSLRDITPAALLEMENVVDDVEHVCREGTSVHLAEALKGDRSFIRGELCDILEGRLCPRSSPEARVVFSPFGLGVLDLAIAGMVAESIEAAGIGTRLDGFSGEPWHARP